MQGICGHTFLTACWEPWHLKCQQAICLHASTSNRSKGVSMSVLPYKECFSSTRGDSAKMSWFNVQRRTVPIAVQGCMQTSISHGLPEAVLNTQTANALIPQRMESPSLGGISMHTPTHESLHDLSQHPKLQGRFQTGQSTASAANAARC